MSEKPNNSIQGIPPAASPFYTGIVKFFDYKKKFGFISMDKGKDVYFHVTGLADARASIKLDSGSKVKFKLALSDKGPKATELSIIV